MRFLSRFFLLALAAIAITAFTYIQREMGVFAPAPPVSVPTVSGDASASRRWTVNRQPTVLAPQANDASDLPPGTPAESDEPPADDTAPISTASLSPRALGDTLFPPATETAIDAASIITMPQLEPPTSEQQRPGK